MSLSNSQFSTLNFPLIPPGYKQTEVGVIPEDWVVAKIGDLIENQFIFGHLDGNHGELYPRSHEFKSYGVPYVGANDFEAGNVTFTRCKFLSDERASQFRKGVARDGDVLFAHNATVGPVALLKTAYPVVIISTTATYFRCNPAKLRNLYLKGALQAQHFVRQYQAVMAQSTRFQVPITAQRKLSLVIPPLPEQQAIATALSDVDALLAGLDQLITKKRDLKQAVMQQLLTGQTRLPGFCGDWEVKSLSKFCSMKSGAGITSANIDQFSKYPCYGGNGLRGYTTSFTHDGGYALVGRQGALCGNVYGAEGQFFASEHAIVVTASADVDIRWLTSVLGRMNLNQYSESSAQPGLSVSKILKLEIIAPPKKSEQTAIAQILTDMDAELSGLEQRRDKTHALKQAMMQELLTGRTRLVNG